MKGTKRDLRVYVDYKGMVEQKTETGYQVRDDYLVLTLKEEDSTEPLAEAVVNFPVIEGKNVLFIHTLTAEKKEGEDQLLSYIEGFSRERGYDTVYLSTGKRKEKSVKRLGFEVLPGRGMARKVLP